MKIPCDVLSSPESFIAWVRAEFRRTPIGCKGVDTNLFDIFPSQRESAQIDEARTICGSCAAIELCKVYADAIERFATTGIYLMYGGESPYERGQRRRLFNQKFAGFLPWWVPQQKIAGKKYRGKENLPMPRIYGATHVTYSFLTDTDHSISHSKKERASA